MTGAVAPETVAELQALGHRAAMRERLLGSPGGLVDAWGAPIQTSGLREAPGAVGTTVVAGHIDELEIDYNSAWLPPNRFSTLEEMSNDEAIEGMLNAAYQPIRGATFKFEPASEDRVDLEVAAFLEETILKRRRGWKFRELLQRQLSHFDQGASFIVPAWGVSESVRGFPGPRMVPTSVDERLLKTIVEWIPGRDGQNSFGGFYQGVWKDGVYQSRIPVPASRIISTWHKRVGSQWWGRSGIRSLYRFWFIKEKLWKLLAMNAERWGVGIPMARKTSPGGHAVGVEDTLRKTLQGIAAHRQGFIDIPYGYEVGLFGDGARAVGSADILAAITYIDSRMGDLLLGQVFNLGKTESGNRALGEVLGKAWVQFETELADASIEGIQELADQATALNFGASVPAPRLTYSPISLDSLGDFATRLGQYSTTGALSVGPEIERAVRRMENLPELDDETLEERHGERKESAKTTVVVPAGPAPEATEEVEELEDEVEEGEDVQLSAKFEAWVAAEWTPFRELRPSERYVQFSEIDRKTKDQVAGLSRKLVELRENAVEEMIPRIEAELRRPDFDDERIDSLAGAFLKKRKPIAKEVREWLIATYDFGVAAVEGELERAASGRPVKLADPPRGKTESRGFLFAAAEAVSRRILQPVIEELIGELEAAKLRGFSDVTTIVASLLGLSENPVRQAAAHRVHEALALGRSDAAQSAGVEFAQYSALLDAATCKPCELADRGESGEGAGTVVKVGSAKYHAMTPPLRPSGFSEGCEGRNNCRCIWVYT